MPGDGSNSEKAPAAPGSPILEITGLHKWFGEFPVLRGVDLSVDKQERIVLCGPSGSGKSTLIRCINGLEAYQQGRVVVDGTDLADPKTNIQEIRAEVGMVFQDFHLFPHLTVLDNLCLAPQWVRHLGRKEAEERAEALLDRVRIREQAGKYPGQLSGGQQQRVAIARALA
ncbi:MAG: amino acid ABC transporter ATP-binding protein, partial [Deltaproteobacteria bacterium]|nr:amino acid ABC transporter ATP-binding protein [Deltaproteobacteria bacterium]